MNKQANNQENKARSPGVVSLSTSAVAAAAAPASLWCVCDAALAASRVCQPKERKSSRMQMRRERHKRGVGVRYCSGHTWSMLGLGSVCVCARDCVRLCRRVCVKCSHLCGAKTNVLLHSSFASKILLLVPLVWLLRCIPPKQPRN